VNDQSRLHGSSWYPAICHGTNPKQPRLCSDIYAVGVIGLMTGYQSTRRPKGEIIYARSHRLSPQLAEVLDKMVTTTLSDTSQQSRRQALQGLTTPMPLLTPTVLPPPKRRAFLWQALIGLGIQQSPVLSSYGPGTSVDL